MLQVQVLVLLQEREQVLPERVRVQHRLRVLLQEQEQVLPVRVRVLPVQERELLREQEQVLLRVLLQVQHFSEH